MHWLGQAGFLIRSRDATVVIDPYLSDSLAVKYRDREFPHERMVPVPIEPSVLTGIDVVLATHGHTDHLDPGTLPALAAANPRSVFIVPRSHAVLAVERGAPAGPRLVTVNAAERVGIGAGDAIRVTAIPAAHEERERDGDGNDLYLGDVVELGGVCVYHSGDTVPVSSLVDALAPFRIDAALLPINGRDAYRASRGVPGNMTVSEAYELAVAIGARTLVGHHFGMFSFNTIDPGIARDEFVRLGRSRAGESGQDREAAAPVVIVPETGVVYRFTTDDRRPTGPAAYTIPLRAGDRSHQREGHMGHTESTFIDLFDGTTLSGWRAAARLPVARMPGGPEPTLSREDRRRIAAHTGSWTVEEGAIVGRQDPPGCGLGAYLISDGVYGDFELILEARPDWPADTGILVRASEVGSQGYQILLDHRTSGNIGGIYGNGIGGFHAINFTLDVERDATGRPIGLRVEDPATTLEPMTPDKPALLASAASGEEFIEAWKWGDWNEFRIRVEGELPRITVLINGLKVSEIDTSTMDAPDYDRGDVLSLLGATGHIAFEVHDNDPRMGDARWGPDAACRWRRIRVCPL